MISCEPDQEEPKEARLRLSFKPDKFVFYVWVNMPNGNPQVINGGKTHFQAATRSSTNVWGA